MRFLVSLVWCLVELTASLGRWLFIVTAPVLLIVAASHYKTGGMCLEPLVGLAVVSGIFAATRWLSLQMDVLGLNYPRNGMEEGGVTSRAASYETEFCNPNLQEEGLKRVTARQEAQQENQRRAEIWRQANPWGGFNPHE